MRHRLPISRATGQCGTIASRLIAFCALLCLFVLIAASGPHLVHHLADLHAGHPHSHTNKSQPTDCLVLSLMQHTPFADDSFAPLPSSFPTAGQAGCEPWLQMGATRRPAIQARSPPVMPCP